MLVSPSAEFYFDRAERQFTAFPTGDVFPEGDAFDVIDRVTSEWWGSFVLHPDEDVSVGFDRWYGWAVSVAKL